MSVKSAAAAFIAVLFLSLPVLPLGAAMVSFLVAETGSEKEHKDYSVLWEDRLMGAFFEAGHIVSNSRRVMGADFSIPGGDEAEEELPEAFRADFDAAAAGGAEFFVLAVLDYSSVSRGGPLAVSLRVFSTLYPGRPRLVYEEEVTTRAGVSQKEEAARALKAALALIPHLRDLTSEII